MVSHAFHRRGRLLWRVTSHNVTGDVTLAAPNTHLTLTATQSQDQDKCAHADVQFMHGLHWCCGDKPALCALSSWGWLDWF